MGVGSRQVRTDRQPRRELGAESVSDSQRGAALNAGPYSPPKGPSPAHGQAAHTGPQAAGGVQAGSRRHSPVQLFHPYGVSQRPSLSIQPSCCQARGWHLPQTPPEPAHRAAEEKDKGPGAAGRAPLTAPWPSEARSARPGSGASSSALAGLPPEPGGLPLSSLGNW